MCFYGFCNTQNVWMVIEPRWGRQVRCQKSMSMASLYHRVVSRTQQFARGPDDAVQRSRGCLPQTRMAPVLWTWRLGVGGFEGEKVAFRLSDSTQFYSFSTLSTRGYCLTLWNDITARVTPTCHTTVLNKQWHHCQTTHRTHKRLWMLKRPLFPVRVVEKNIPRS